MSLINQVLNDLEKRGVARAATGDDTIRVVPFRSDSKLWPYFLLAGFILFAAIVAFWLYVHKPTVQQQPVARLSDASSSVPMTGVLSISHVAIASQPQPASSVEQALITKAGPVPGKPQIIAAKPASGVHAALSVASKSENTGRLVMTVPAGNPIKKVSPQQQAENEFRSAYLLAQQGKLSEAISGYKLALSLDPAHAMAREALVSALQESKRYAEAENILQEALTLDVKQTHFAMLLARLQVERNAVPLAIETLERSSTYATRLAEYQAFMAALLQRQSRHKEAVTYYQNALEISPNSGLWLMGMGISLQAEQRKDEALDAFKHALETHRLSPDLDAFVNQRIKEIKP